MANQLKISLATLGVLVAAGCASYPQHDYPMLPLPTDHDRALACEQLDDEILRGDAVRWSMRSEGIRVRTSATNTGGLLANLTLIAVGGVSVPLPNWGDQALLSAADARIVGLLEIKSSKACPARATVDPSVTDLDVLRQLQTSEADWKANRISEFTAITDRMRLLDGLCDPQAIRASRSDATLPGS